MQVNLLFFARLIRIFDFAEDSFFPAKANTTAMIPQPERQQIIDLIRREVVPAIGCTEPIAVALCTARAAELLGALPEKSRCG